MNESNNMKNGISLISLIITIIVIIILAAIVIFSGLNTPDRANFAKFAQSFSDYSTAIMGDYTKKKTQYAVGGQSRTDAQIYYIIATGDENVVDVNDAPTAVATIEKLGLALHPEQLNGTEYYEITSDSNIDGINKQMQFYEAGEKHYVTDAGEAFTLPGYLVAENGTNRWYINEKKYYESDEPIKGPFSFDVSEWKLLSANDVNSAEVEGKLEKDNESAYIYFTATANGEPATISYTPNSEGETISDTGKILLPISDNGEYNFTITAEIDGMQKTTTKKITIVDRFIQMTKASAFKFNSRTGAIEGLKSGYENLEEIKIPSKINGVIVTNIYVSAFYNNKNIKSVTIPSTVTSISSSAFKGCTALDSIELPNSLTSIGSSAFYECSNLSNITIPTSVNNLGDSAFSYCVTLNDVVVPPNITTIKNYTFSNCKSLNNITISYGVTEIKQAVFQKCTSLESITIPSSVTSIGNSCFYQCSSLKNVIIPSSITELSPGIFQECTKLETISIPNGITSIEGSAFYRCYLLKSITIPASVTNIANQAFYDCNRLKDVYYEGTETQWNNITGSNTIPLMDATKHYESTGPETL